MNSLIETLSELFGSAFEAQDLPAELGKVAISGRPDLADFQCNGALQAAKQKKMNPRALAEAIIASLPENAGAVSSSIRSTDPAGGWIRAASGRAGQIVFVADRQREAG